jgi:hypothetical protein
MQIIPTWEVILYPDDEKNRTVYRVPEAKLAGTLEVLVFNRIEDFRVLLEERSHAT